MDIVDAAKGLLWICFPVWRELKQVYSLASTTPDYPSLWICFPVWRELKQKYQQSLLQSFVYFGYAFPFEGNWNLKSVVNVKVLSVVFGYAFPFEGNWNMSRGWSVVLFSAPLDMLSRLKGIETPLMQPSPCFSLYFGYAFPFEGNWNSMSWIFSLTIFTALDMLSRLKGIETHIPTMLFVRLKYRFGYAFPFEGNWNAVRLMYFISA